MKTRKAVVTAPCIDIYWQAPMILSARLADGSKLRIDWQPKTKTLTLDGSFGRQIVSCLDPLDHPGETLEQAAVDLAEKFVLAPPPGVKPIADALEKAELKPADDPPEPAPKKRGRPKKGAKS